MIIPVKYGFERSPINVGEHLVWCPTCESTQWAEIMVFSEYFHIYYVPIYPHDKDAMVVCEKCGLRRHGVPVNAKLISNYPEVKDKYRHKWYMYIGVAILASPFVALILFWIIGSFEHG